MIRILLKNELFKLMKKKKLYVFMIIIMFLCILHAGISYKYDNSKDIDWRGSAEEQIKYAEEYYQQNPDEINTESYKELQKQQVLAGYILDNNLSSIYLRTYGSAVFESLDLLIVVMIITIVITCDVFCEDYSLKTIKVLFTRPNKRMDVWISKLLALIVCYIILSVVLVLTSVVTNLFFYNSFEANQCVIFVNDYGDVVEKSYFIYLIQNYFTLLIEAIGYILLTAVGAVMFKNSSIAAAFSIAALLGGNVVISIYEQKIEWLKYTLFYNMDLSQYLNNEKNFWNTSPTFSIVVIMLHFAVFFYLGKQVYCKQEIY